MQDIRFEKVSDDTTILAIGSLFRRVNHTQWGINLDLAPQLKSGRCGFRIFLFWLVSGC